MTNLCQYKDVFGKPREGVHSYRFLGVAVVDVVMTLFAAVLLSLFLKTKLWKTTLFLFILAIILHRMFCVNTRINVLLFGQK